MNKVIIFLPSSLSLVPPVFISLKFWGHEWEFSAAIEPMMEITQQFENSLFLSDWTQLDVPTVQFIWRQVAFQSPSCKREKESVIKPSFSFLITFTSLIQMTVNSFAQYLSSDTRFPQIKVILEGFKLVWFLILSFVNNVVRLISTKHYPSTDYTLILFSLYLSNIIYYIILVILYYNII